MLQHESIYRLSSSLKLKPRSKMADKKFSKYETSVYLWFLQVVTVLGLTFLVIWETLIPKTPIFTISNMDFRPHQNDSTLISRNSSLVFNVTISNPNKGFGIYFDDLNLTLHCKNDTVWSKSLPGFYLDHKNSDMEELELLVDDHDKHFCGGITSGKVDLRVGLETKVRYKILRYKTKHRRLVFEDYVQIGADGPMLETKDMKLAS